jgi:hypothetical protein
LARGGRIGAGMRRDLKMSNKRRPRTFGQWRANTGAFDQPGFDLPRRRRRRKRRRRR